MSTRADTLQHRLEAMVPAIPYVMLALSTAGAVLVDDTSAPGPTLALAAVALGWLLLRRFMSPAVYIAGLLALFVALVSRSPLFGFFVFTGYLSVEALPLWWRAPPLAITAILSGVCQVGGWPLQEWASWPVLLAVVVRQPVHRGRDVRRRARSPRSAAASARRWSARRA